jgi:hypothetical protein
MKQPPASPSPPARTPPARSNPAPRRALVRVRPLVADESGSGAANRPSPEPDAGPAGGTRPAADPVGPSGRDVLIPGRGEPASARERRAARPAGAPVVPALVELMPGAEPAGRTGKAHRSGHGGGGHGKRQPDNDGKRVELVLSLPKPLRKRLRAKAAELGLSPEQAAEQLVQVWVDG